MQHHSEVFKHITSSVNNKFAFLSHFYILYGSFIIWTRKGTDIIQSRAEHCVSLYAAADKANRQSAQP